jgi:hypothetical protein
MKLRHLAVLVMAAIAIGAGAQNSNVLSPSRPNYDQRLKELENKIASLQDRVQKLEEQSKSQLRPPMGNSPKPLLTPIPVN